MTKDLIAIALIYTITLAAAFHVQASDDGVVTPEPVGVEISTNEVMNTNGLRKSFNQISQQTSFEKKVVKTPEMLLVSGESTPVAKITTYGVDCYGCYNNNGFGGTAGGVKVSTNPSVLQSNGSWQTGITYDGYYIVAANSAIAMGSIIEVSNHGFNGYGLVEGQTFYAMVLDRGAMTLNHLDLFVGSEAGNAITINRSYTPTMKVIRNGY